MKVQESAENYLETILILKNKNGVVRSIDIANMLNFTKPSVSVAMKSLRENGYIEMGTDSLITLTQKGLTIAEKIYERHQTIAKALIALGVDEENAFTDSCRIEHVISEQSFQKIKEHLKQKGL